MFLSSGRRKSPSNSAEKPVRRRLALALEQRFMFDAAGAATVAATIPTDDSSSGDTHHADTTNTTHPALAPEAPAENAPPPATQILFVAPDVQDFDTLTVAEGVEVVRLQAGIDAIAQISSYLDGRRYRGTGEVPDEVRTRARRRREKHRTHARPAARLA